MSVSGGRRLNPKKRSSHLSIEKRLIWFCGVALLAMPAMAQNAPILRPGVTEVGGFIGASYGIDKTRVMRRKRGLFAHQDVHAVCRGELLPRYRTVSTSRGHRGLQSGIQFASGRFQRRLSLADTDSEIADHTLWGHLRRWDSHPRAYFQRNLSEPGDSDADRFAVRPTLMRAPISPPASVQVFATIRPSVLDFARSSRPISRLTRVPTTTCFTG